MDTRGNDRLREMLAAEYALGTLRGGARRRFERWMRNDAGLVALAAAWSTHLTPLVDSVPPRTPPSRVWDAIEARLPGFTARHGASFRAPAITGWWDRLALWRGLSAAFAVVAAVALALAMRPAPAPQTQFVQVQTLPGSIATLTDPKTNAPVALVMASRTGDEVIVRVTADVPLGTGQVLQLWSTPNGKDLVSMGVLPHAAPGEAIRLPAVDAARLASTKAFGLSLEPVGGSPQPTHVLGLGALVRMST